jgi:Tol biopolymer transport system component
MGVRRARVVVGALGSCALLMAQLAAPAAATFPGRNGRIAFSTWTDAGTSLSTIHPNGSGRQVIADGAVFEDPSWSRNGRWLVVSRTPARYQDCLSGCIDPTSLVIMRADGSDRRKVTTSTGDVRDPSFSANGRRILYSVYRYAFDGSSSKMFSIRRDGTDKRRIARRLDGLMSGLTQSPNGKRYAFAFWPDGKPGDAIYTKPSGGGGLRRLTPFNGSQEPDWSPDSRRLVFTRWSAGWDRAHIARMRRDGSGLRRLTGRGESVAPTWSPNGRWIVYEREGDRPSIHVMRADGSDKRKVVGSGRGWPTDPSWQPLPD